MLLGNITRRAVNYRYLVLMLFAILIHSVIAESEPRKPGLPYIKNYTPKEYGAQPKNSAIVQDKRGVMYFGNEDGILEYDGVEWRLIRTKNHTIVRSLDIDDDSGTIYAGAEGEFGYLSPNNVGELHFISLISKVPSENRVFGDVWQTLATSHGIYFRSEKYLFCWKNNEIKVWEPVNRFHSAFVVKDRFFVRQWEVGLMEMIGEQLTLVPDGEMFSDERVYAMLLYEPADSEADPDSVSEILIGSRSQGLFLLDNESIRSFPTDVDQLLIDSQIYHGSSISSSTSERLFAFATQKGGVIIINRQGNLWQVIDQTTGLQNNFIRFIYQDKQGGIWLALENGISRIRMVSAVSIFDDRFGLPGVPRSMARHKGKLYTATPKGVFYFFQSHGGSQASFRQVDGIKSQCRSMLSIGDRLLLATDDGVFQIHKGDPEFFTLEEDSKNFGRYALCLHHSRIDDSRLFIGLRDGFVTMKRIGGEWEDLGRINGISERIESIGQDKDGRIWLGTRYQGVISVHFFSGYHINPRIRRYNSEKGLPEGEIVVRTLNDRTVFSTTEGLYRYDPVKDRMTPDFSLGEEVVKHFKSSKNAMIVASDSRGDAWINCAGDMGIARYKTDGSYRWEKKQLLQVSDADVHLIFPEEVGGQQTIWFASSKGLIRYDPSGEKSSDYQFNVLIRQMIVNSDSLLYGGYGKITNYTRSRVSENGTDALSSRYTVFSHRKNALRFHYAILDFDQESANQYQFRMIGLSNSWSNWSRETRNEYTNLSEGMYCFQVKGMNLYGDESKESIFMFRILPPWYRTWWAYTLYGLSGIWLFFSSILGYGRYQSIRQKKVLAAKQKELEKEKLAARNLQKVNDRMRQLDAIKDEFLANTSHELRTPLNGIIGLAESLVEGATGELNALTKENLRMIVSSGRRLSTLINDILDFSKLKNRNLVLKKRPIDMCQIANVVLTLSKSLIAGKELKLTNCIPKDLPPAECDENRIQQIMYNLVGNAIKFTESGGSVEVNGSADSETQMLTISVSDTGIGIPEEKHELIFQSFEQGDGSTARQYGGTGLGLAVTKQLVELHGGIVSMESEVDVGSTFSFTLPISDKSLDAEQLELVQSTASFGSEEEDIEDDETLDAIPELEIEESPPVSEGIHSDAEKKPKKKDQNGDSQQTYHVLVVDDEPVNLQVISNFLSLKNYKITRALNGIEALKHFENDAKFDLVLLDVMMPHMSGYEVCERIRDMFPASTLPIILLTAKNQISDLVTGFSSGANDYLTKPFSKNELMARMDTHLSLSRINRASSRFVPSEFLKFLQKESLVEVKLGDQVQREMTILFSDIRSFTTLSESMTPEENFTFINEYLSLMEPHIIDNHGFIDKYIGDAIMALFGRSADDGVEAAVGMLNTLDDYNRDQIKAGGQQIKIGVGLNTGMLMLGTVGGNNRMDGTVISDAVNLASRIEGMTKMYGAAILISDQTLSKLEDPKKYTTRIIDRVKVKGKNEPITVYEVIDGDPIEIREIKAGLRTVFADAWDLYCHGEFEDALTLFNLCYNKFPEDKPTQIYIERCEHLIEIGKPDDWDGVMTLTSK
ncbi:MAG: hypothetical protein B6244_03390 [Candidatus Cloacimonetes bacterium 4572_55]|nr:MAG: hypothetical protein B6244_03390 [Candidatus Cloacimonetes bacterium 4572_55]